LDSIVNIAKKIDIKEDNLELYGKYKAKISQEFINSIQNNKEGKLILVTAINPTSMGEGKTTTTIALGQAFAKLNKKVCLALREPSLGPCFGVKGGATGGGYSQVAPMEDINLHFTGDIHAITTANNLLSALIDNHLYNGNKLNISRKNILWKRCLDLNDRSLREIELIGEKPRKENFLITVASEIMAILCLSTDLQDLKKRLGNILIAYSKKGEPIFAKDLKAEGSMAVLLKDAIKPNLVQTLEGVPTIIHGGPFANIAHGCNSIIATKTALKLADYVVTEAGFGADLGAEKFFDIKCRKANLKPSAVVLVATIRALKYNGNGSLEKGICNLGRHIENLKKYKLQVVVSLNRFTDDTEEEIEFVKKYCEDFEKKYIENGIEIKQFGTQIVYRCEKTYVDNLDKNIKKLLEQKPLASITDNEFHKDKKIREEVEKYYNSIGGFVERENFGKILLSKSSIKSSIAHGWLDIYKANAFKSVPDILKNGIILNKIINWKERGYNTYLVCGVILINEIEYIVEIIVKETKLSKNFYLHQVVEKRKFNGQRVMPISDEEPPSTTILEQFIYNVKKSPTKINFALCEGWAKGGNGAINLANEVLDNITEQKSHFKLLYEQNISIKEKINKIATEIYRAKEVKFIESTEEEIKQIEELGFTKLPVCIAKTQYSFSDDKNKLGAPTDFIFTIKKVRVSAGAGFIVCEAGDIMTMPGLPKHPLAEVIDIDNKGIIKGMM
jgi:formyltetrahydrofolate synthetase